MSLKPRAPSDLPVSIKRKIEIFLYRATVKMALSKSSPLPSVCQPWTALWTRKFRCLLCLSSHSVRQTCTCITSSVTYTVTKALENTQEVVNSFDKRLLSTWCGAGTELITGRTALNKWAWPLSSWSWWSSSDPRERGDSRAGVKGKGGGTRRRSFEISSSGRSRRIPHIWKLSSTSLNISQRGNHEGN